MAGQETGLIMTKTAVDAALNSLTGVLRGKRGLVMGLANNRSIAWGIAKAARLAGAEIALTYQGEALERRVRPLAAELDAHVVGECDVTAAASIDAVFAAVEKLSVLDLSELVKVLEEKFGVSAAAPVMMAGAGAGAAAAEEKSSFNVELTEAGSNKIAAAAEALSA